MKKIKEEMERTLKIKYSNSSKSVFLSCSEYFWNFSKDSKFFLRV